MIKEIHIVYSEDSKLTADDLLDQSKLFHKQNIDFYPYFGKNEFRMNFESNQNPLLEYIVKKSDETNINSEKADFLINFHSCLKVMAVSSDLIIVDPYFYSKGRIEMCEQRLNLFKEMIQPISNELKTIKIITDESKGNLEFIEKFELLIREINHSIEIKNYYTIEIHDRFWLNPIKNKGLVIGTSLNGLFKKYCYFDNLNDDDAGELIEVMAELFPSFLG